MLKKQLFMVKKPKNNVMNYGFIKVAAAIPQVKVADCSYNAEQIINLIHTAEEKGVNISVFPELCITGYTCGDLFAQQQLYNFDHQF